MLKCIFPPKNQLLFLSQNIDKFRDVQYNILYDTVFIAFKEENKLGVGEKQILELLEILKGCQFTDILGLGNYLEVEEIDPFEDYVAEICLAYSQKSRRERRKLLKLMRDVSRANLGLEAKPFNLKIKETKEEVKEENNN